MWELWQWDGRYIKGKKLKRSKTKQTVFDAPLFGRLLAYTKPYYSVFLLALITVIGLAVLGR